MTEAARLRHAFEVERRWHDFKRRMEARLSRGQHVVDAYAEEIVAADTSLAGRYHRLACQRHLNDRARNGAYPYVFDPAKADKFFRFTEQAKHYKGEWAGQPIDLSYFQRFRLGCVFGWREKDNRERRRFTTSYHELPRKHGKSLEAAVSAIYVTFFEGEPGAEGYVIATKEKQATDIVFANIRSMVLSSPGLKKRLRVLAKNVHRESDASKIEPLGSDSETQDGLNPHSVTTDELHAFKHRGLLDVMETAMGARRNPLHNQITTAGETLISVCGDQHVYATRILEGVLEGDAAAERFFACIAHADSGDDPWDEATWRKANPHWGISVSPDYIRGMAAKAIQIPSAQATFKQKILNLWVNAARSALPIESWRAGQSQIDPQDFAQALHGRRCYVGVDLASSIDLCSMSILFPPTQAGQKWMIVQRIWTPEETMRERAKRDRAPYDIWAQQGWLIAAPGKRVNHDLVRAAIVEANRLFQIQLICFDPWHAEQLAAALVTADGFPEEHVVAIAQTYAGMSAAETEFKALVTDSEIDACDCPVTDWAVENVAEVPDGKGNIMFSKPKSRSRIDPVKSATIALAGYKKQHQPEKEYQVIVVGGAAQSKRR
jgi:phage terminase large subunit-like protein